MNNKTKVVAINAIIAAVYAILTINLSVISYGAVQFRLSEVMTLLACFNPLYTPGLIIGCFIANLYSPFGIIDIVFGTLATALSVISMTKIKNIYISSLMPTIFNAIIIGAVIWYTTKSPLLETMIYIAIGEFVVVSIIGVPIYKILEKRFLEYKKV